MAKGKGQQNSGKQEKKRSFWSNFFEPVEFDDEGDEELDLFDDEDEDDEDEFDDGFGEDKPKKKNAKKKDKGRRKGREAQDEAPVSLFSDDELEYSDEIDLSAVDNLTWDDGEPVVEDPFALAPDIDSAAPEKRVELPEEIRLFDDDDEDESLKRSSRTRIFRTGSRTAARIHINETEELQRVEQARKEQREREANRKHKEYLTKQQRRKRRRQAIRNALGNIAFGGFIVAGVAVAMYYAFLLSDIIVVGNETYSTDYVVQLSGLQYGKHMFTVNLDEAKEKIEENPYLQVDSLTYIFPSRVRIAVTERKEVAGIIGLDYNVIIDKNGYVLSMGGSTDISDLLQVTGINMTGFQLGQRLGDTDDFGTATLIQIIGKLEEYDLLGSIASIDLTTPLAITMIAKNGLKIQVGQPTDLDEKMLSLHSELPQFMQQNVYWGTLFLSAKGGTVYSPRELADILAQSTATPEDDTTAPEDGATTPEDGTTVPEDGGTGDNTMTSPSPSPSTAPAGGGEDEFQG